MPIMAASEFHKRKAIGKKEHKNPIAADIYTLLKAYESATNSPNRKIKLLVLIYFLCMEYVWAKNGTKKGGFDPSTRKNQKNKVVQLLQQIETEVDSPAFQQQLTNMVGGEHYKGGVKQRDAGTGRALQGHYATEKIAPEANPVNKYNLHTRIPAFGMSLLTQTFELEFQLQGHQGQQSEQLAHTKITGLSLTELFEELHKLWHNVNTQQQTFTFFNSAQRLPYLATCANGVWSCNNKSPYTTGINFGQLVPITYAMDVNERLFIADGIATGTGNFNHSSVLGGAPCICAGLVKIDATGKLVYIDNDSGHYKPTRADLRAACTILKDDYGIPCFGVHVYDKGSNQTKSMFTI